MFYIVINLILTLQHTQLLITTKKKQQQQTTKNNNKQKQISNTLSSLLLYNEDRNRSWFYCHHQVVTEKYVEFIILTSIFVLKVIHSEKASNIKKTLPILFDITLWRQKIIRRFFQIFVAFSENLNTKTFFFNYLLNRF